jgi:hypothetical protein
MSMEGCNKHPTVRAEYRCQQCSKPVCGKCIVNDRFCSPACNDKYSTFYKNYKKPANTGGSNIPAILIFIAVVVGLYYAYKNFKHLLPL